MQLMWKGIADYVLHYKIGVLFGCASFPGTDPQEHKAALSYLYHRHLAPPEYRAARFARPLRLDEHDAAGARSTRSAPSCRCRR